MSKGRLDATMRRSETIYIFIWQCREGRKPATGYATVYRAYAMAGAGADMELDIALETRTVFRCRVVK